MKQRIIRCPKCLSDHIIQDYEYHLSNQSVTPDGSHCGRCGTKFINNVKVEEVMEEEVKNDGV